MPSAAIGAGISGVSSIVSSLIGGNSATKASNTIGGADLQAAQLVNQNAGISEKNIGEAVTNGQAGVGQATTNAQNTIGGAVNNANGILSGVYNGLQSNLQPYLQAGTQGAQQLTSATAPGGSLSGQFNFDPTQIANNPDYQFQLQQGLQAVQRSQAASGQLTGGGTLKALTQYSQGLASNEIGQAYNQALTTYQTNRQNTLQNINALLSTGQFGTSSLQQAAQNYGNQAASNTIGGAQYQGNVGLQGAQYQGNLGVQGAQLAAGVLNNQAVQDTSLLQNKANASASSNLANGYSLSGAINGGLQGAYGIYQGLAGSRGGGGGSFGNPFPTTTVGGGNLWGSVGAPVTI